MGKSSRVKSAKETVAQMKKEKAAQALAAQKRKTKITIITSVVCVVLVAAFITTVALISSYKKSGNLLRNQTILSTENFSVSGTTFKYFLNYEYQNFVNDNANYLESYGLDVTVPLRDQETSDGQNWFDYMVSRTQSSLEEILRLCEKAKAEGYKLEETELKQKDEYIATLKKEAADNKLSLDEYIGTLYGEGIKADDIVAGLELSMLATKYYDETIAKKEYTEDEINSHFDKNKNDFLLADYIYYTFTAEKENGLNKDAATKSLEEAKKKAQELAMAKTPSEFESILTKLIKADGGNSDDITDTLANINAKGCTYDPDFSISKWSFGKDVKLYDTQLYINENRVSAYMITKLPYRDESETRSVRHILVSITDTVKDADAKKKADDILAEYNKGTKNGVEFGKLATKYTDDTGSAATGGLYENFPKGKMVKEFEDWSFDAARQNGDTAIVKTSYGYHVMFFESKGMAAWKNNVVAAMKDAEYTTLYEALEKAHKTTFNAKVLDNIDTIVFRTSNPTLG